MTRYAELEIGLHRRDAERYQIELRFSRPDSDTDDRLMRSDAVYTRFDWGTLRGLALRHDDYGKVLGENLFASQEVYAAFEKARTVAQSLDAPLRLRLFIGPSAPELHSLRWETLRDPQSGVCLLTDQNILFSRYLGSFDWRAVRLRPQSDLRALVVIANPQSSEGEQMASIDVEAELAQARAGLGEMVITVLASGGQATVNNIMAHLRDGYDMLYLVAHGILVDNEPWLWLEDGAGQTQRVSGAEFADYIRELTQQPRLVVLVSCQSAGTGQETEADEQGVLTATGPRLAEAGVPAVIAMQGNLKMKTAAEFLPVFFQELQRDGQIDRAISAARGTVRKEPDWWMPVLFMRLKSGRIWYAPGFAEDQKGLEKWPALLQSIEKRRCTPILGPDLTETLLGSRREIARRWAETYHFPMAPHECEELPQVAQYLAIDQDPMFPRESLVDYLRQELFHRYGNILAETIRKAPLDDLIRTVGAQHLEHDPAKSYRILAELPFPMYINTNPSNLLADALTTAGKEPRVELCRWSDYIEYPSIYEEEPDYQPDEQHPLVYHLFGSFEDLESVVLTEDDYFDYLLGVARNNDLIPADVRRALTDTALLFLGFQMNDWNFRVLFRSIMSREGGGRRKRYAHVAAQITPEEGRILEPERARRYLEKYFQDARISIYWGSADDFVQELHQHWKGK